MKNCGESYRELVPPGVVIATDLEDPASPQEGEMLRTKRRRRKNRLRKIIANSFCGLKVSLPTGKRRGQVGEEKVRNVR